MNKQPHMNENVIAGNVRGIRKRDAFTCWDEARRFDQWGDLNVGVLDRIRDKSVYKIYNFKFDNKTQLTNCSVILVDTTCCP